MVSKETWKKRIKYAVKNNDSTLDTLAESLQVLEILKNKKVDLVRFSIFKDKNVYNLVYWSSPELQLTQKEFNRIEEWLNND